MNHLEKEPFEDINVNGARIRLVGTAHVSQASTDFVIEQIEKGSYDCVAVELCASRCQQLIEPEAVENMDLFEIIKKKKVLALAVMLAMLFWHCASDARPTPLLALPPFGRYA